MAKWTLTIEEEGGQTHRVDLVRDAYALGRDPSNDIVFRERNISRRHARLERAGPGRWAIVDEGSRSGCFINGERVEGRGVISPVDAIQIGGYHLSVLSSSGKRGGLSPALSVTRSLLVPVDVPPKLRLFDGLAPVADVRLDRGPVTLGSDSDCTVRLLGVEGALVHIRPLPGGTFEIVDRGDVVLVRLKGQELRRKILENADLFDLGDDLAVRFLQGGRHARTDEPAFSPSPLVDLANGVAEAKVLGVEGVPVLRQGPVKSAASSTLMGLQAPRPPPLPASSTSATPTDPLGWTPEPHDGRVADADTEASGAFDDQTEQYQRPQPARGREGPPPARGREGPPPRTVTERLAPVPLRPPSQPPAWAPAPAPAPAATPPPPPAPVQAVQPTPLPPPADMGWPMGPRSPSSAPGPGPDAWWFAGPPPPAVPGAGMTQPLRVAQAPSPPPMRQGLVTLVVLGPLAAGVLATALFVANRRPPPGPAPSVAEPTTTAEAVESALPPPSAAPPAESAPHAAPAAPSASAAEDAPAPTPSDSVARPGAKPPRPGKSVNTEAERLRQLRCQQYGKCDLSPGRPDQPRRPSSSQPRNC